MNMKYRVSGYNKSCQDSVALFSRFSVFRVYPKSGLQVADILFLHLLATFASLVCKILANWAHWAQSYGDSCQTFLAHIETVPGKLFKSFSLYFIRKLISILRGVQWRIGSSIGLGGFGEIYAASRVKKGNGENGDCQSEDFIVKVEPHTNGPLFVEIAFYLKVIIP